MCMSPTKVALLVSALLASLAALAVAVARLSPRFDPVIPMADRPVEALTLLLAGMGVVFFALSRLLFAYGVGRPVFASALAVGLFMRAVMISSVPILETDFHRYLWDGAVLSQGINPFRPVPEQALEVQGPLTSLALQSGNIAARINHPELRTIYPPVAQAFFAASYQIAPWSLAAWRGILLAADLATLALLLGVLGAARLPACWSLVYWLNPLVLKEIHNAAHMDVLLAPFLLGALLLAHRGRLLPAMLCLVAATGLKTWPVILLPLLLRTSQAGPGRKTLAAALFAGMVAVLHIPVLAAGLDATSGFTAYAGRWEMNDGPYLALLAVGRLAEATGLLPISARSVATAMSVSVLAGVIAFTVRSKVADLHDLVGRALLIVAALFIVSPTQFPWYATWFLPFLAVRPSWGLLLYAVTLPVYYLRFRFDALGAAHLFDNVVVWLEHGPVLALLIAAKWRPRWVFPVQCPSWVPGMPAGRVPEGC